MQSRFIVTPKISQEWTEDKRRMVWFLISSARQGLGISIDPIVASAFIILQKYFRGEFDNEYDLFILMSAALFASCKINEVFRSASDIIRELYKLCVRSRSKLINQIVSKHCVYPDYTVAGQDVSLVLTAEIDLLRAIDFVNKIDLPFAHFDKWKKNMIEQTLMDENFLKLCNNVMLDICLLICSCYYLDVPPEVAAAAAASRTFGNDEWVISVRQKFGDDIFNLAMNSIRFEDSRTMKRY